MRIRTLLFATYREMAGAEELDLELPDGATAADLVGRLRDHPGLAALPAEPALAVNQVYAPLTTDLADGDEVALLPPVAGG
ncbi:MAG: MoaD/ThiS family protein [Gemmatimonadetes bacterium]|nr:MoaD/ThiS family protein [Gemmatimonadota bacterium]NIQ52597.1 MoaD/ThiS family protein [Gemmatimonadota bacterium]NIU72736.1 MoaD/ThiS family protein [Gammaproteobacteria bacterium]NIX43136.1 MoaD/ThiS family protein [Gemmatimonadota bacterium]NIY07298.1 MoaD/ThiS family protein [Gemmatimonadota bacterium]